VWVIFCIFHFFLKPSTRSEGSDPGIRLLLGDFSAPRSRTETEPYPFPAGGNNSPLAFASGLCGEGVGEAEGEDEKDRDLERKDTSLGSVPGTAGSSPGFYRITESFGSGGTPRGHLVQPPRSEQGHR